MANLRLLIVLVFALIALVMFENKNFFSNNSQSSEAEKNTPIPSPSPIKPKSTPIEPRFNRGNSAPTLSPTPASPALREGINNFIYPNSSNITGDGDISSMESADKPQIITDWYKEKIKSMGMKATSFVQTTTNGNVLNKLAGANNSFGIVVEIRKAEFDTKTSIRLIIKD